MAKYSYTPDDIPGTEDPDYYEPLEVDYCPYKGKPCYCLGYCGAIEEAEEENSARDHCMCGDRMDSHGYDGNYHSPISMYDYSEMKREQAHGVEI